MAAGDAAQADGANPRTQLDLEAQQGKAACKQSSRPNEEGGPGDGDSKMPAVGAGEEDSKMPAANPPLKMLYQAARLILSLVSF